MGIPLTNNICSYIEEVGTNKTSFERKASTTLLIANHYKVCLV